MTGINKTTDAVTLTYDPWGSACLDDAARATGGLEQRLAGPRLGGAPAPVGPKLRPSRSAHRPASPRQAAAQRGVVEEGAVLRVVVGHESAPMAQRARPAHRVRSRSPSWVRAGSRDARVMTLGGAPRRRSPEAPRSRICRKCVSQVVGRTRGVEVDRRGASAVAMATRTRRPERPGSSRLARASKLKEIAGA